MSIFASNIIRCLVVLLAGFFFIVLWAFGVRAWEALFPVGTPLLYTWDDEISGAIVLAWTAFVVVHMIRQWRTPLAETYGPVLRSAAILHLVIFCLAALMLDGGLMLQSCFLAAALFWMTVGMILARRPSSPTEFDLAVVARAFLLVPLFVTCMAYCVPGIIVFH